MVNIIHTRNNEILAQLQELYPGAFPKEEVRILNIGIYQDLRKDGKITAKAKELWRFFTWYCSRKAYSKLHISGTPRYNLNGEIEGSVTTENELSKSLSSNRRNTKPLSDTSVKTP